MPHNLAKIKINHEVAAGVLLVLVFSGFLLANFIVGFNLFLYALAAAVGILLPIAWPRAGLYAITALTLIFAKFFTLQALVINEVEYKFYLVDILFCATLLGLGLRYLAGEIKLKARLADWLLVLFMILTGVYFFLSIWSWDGQFAVAFSSFKNYAFYPLFYFVAYLLLDSRGAWRSWLKFVWGGAVVIIGFLIYGITSGQGLWTEITPLSTAGNRWLDFDHAWYAALLALYGFNYLVGLRSGKFSAWFYILTPLWLLGVLGSLMRHLWLAMVFALAGLYLILSHDQRWQLRRLVRRYLAVGVMALAVIMLLVFSLPGSRFSRQTLEVPQQFLGRAASLVDSADTSIAWRGAVWQSVWQEARGRLVSGLGFGQKVFIDLNNYRDYIEVRNIHNSWLAIFVQLGAVGFILLAWFYLNIFKNLLVVRPVGRVSGLAKYSLLSVLLFCAVAFLFQPYLEANFFNIFFWLSLGLARRTYEGLTS